MTILRKQTNLLILFLAVFLFGFYIYQTVSTSSGRVALVNLKKEFLERKNNLNYSEPALINSADLNSGVRENLKMVEIEKFDYIIIGPSEFALFKKNESISQ